MNKQELIEKYKSALNKAHKVYGDYYKTEAYEEVLKDLKQLDEPQKVTVLQFVADLIEEARIYEWDLDDLFEHISEYSGDSEVSIWFYTLGNIDILARAWLDGYEVEKEKQYTVKMKGVDSCFECLYYGMGSNTWSFRMKHESGYFRRSHTRKELEDAGFGEVFNSPLFEVEEVEE